jgi:hypothetical protein
MTGPERLRPVSAKALFSSRCRGQRARARTGLGGAATPALAVPDKNIVAVHGAWVDGSGWKPVYETLIKWPTGYPINEVNRPSGLTLLIPRISFLTS